MMFSINGFCGGGGDGPVEFQICAAPGFQIRLVSSILCKVDWMIAVSSGVARWVSQASAFWFEHAPDLIEVGD